jgi:hypothetical protein
MTRADVSHSVQHALHDLVDGAHAWGSLDQAPARSTVVQQITLTVHRPGTSVRDRRLLHARRTWPLTGAVLSALLVLALASWVPVHVVGLTVLAVWCLGSLLLEVVTRPVRGSARELTASSTCTPGGLVVVGDAACVRATAARLFALERELEAGHISPSRYLALWEEVWRALPSGSGTRGARP